MDTLDRVCIGVYMVSMFLLFLINGFEVDHRLNLIEKSQTSSCEQSEQEARHGDKIN
jgi:hypothetical protein